MLQIKRQVILLTLFIISFSLVVWWQNIRLQENFTSNRIKSVVASTIEEPLQPIPLEIKLNPDKVKLGQKLFEDPQLSRNNTLSCASCHRLSQGGTDRRAKSIGINQQVGTINSPTIFNSSYNFKQFWDGRADSLTTQIDGPIHADNEMDSSWSEIIGKLQKSSEYIKAFTKIYSDGVREANIKDAIVSFIESLSTPNSPFDRYLRGDETALTQEEKEGYRLFKDNGCASCHQGVNVGGNMFQGFGIMGNYFADRGNITKDDIGRYNVTKDENDRYVFKVPSLRNVALTPPYFHDGSAKNLERAVKVMAKYQLGRELASKDIDLIIKFINTLNGEYQGKKL